MSSLPQGRRRVLLHQIQQGPLPHLTPYDWGLCQGWGGEFLKGGWGLEGRTNSMVIPTRPTWSRPLASLLP